MTVWETNRLTEVLAGDRTISFFPNKHVGNRKMLGAACTSTSCCASLVLRVFLVHHYQWVHLLGAPTVKSAEAALPYCKSAVKSIHWFTDLWL